MSANLADTLETAESEPISLETSIAELLHSHTRGEIDLNELSQGLRTLCNERFATNRDVVWETLSLLDQFHRRELVATRSYMQCKSALHAFAFGVAPKSLTDDTFTSLAINRSSANASSKSAHQATEAAEPRTTSANASGSKRAAECNATLADTKTLRAGRVLLNRYALISPLAHTSRATLFKAVDRSLSASEQAQHPIWIKALNDKHSRDPNAQQALRTEFANAQSLAQPNIVAVFDCLQENDSWFVTMEANSGQFLDYLLDRWTPNTLALRDALSMVRDVGFALAYAHEQGVHHGDLRPSSIFVTDAGKVLLTGFAQSLSSEAVTQDSDSRADLSALARLTFRLITGAEFDASGDRNDMALKALAQGITQRQWNALEHALLAIQERKRGNVRQWLAEFDLRGAAPALPALAEITTATAHAVAAPAKESATGQSNISHWRAAALAFVITGAIIGAAVWIVRALQ